MLNSNRTGGHFGASRPASDDRARSHRLLPALSVLASAFHTSIRVRFSFALAFALIGITLTAGVWKATQHTLLSAFEHTVHEVRTDMTPPHNIAVALLETERLVRLYEKDRNPATAGEFELAADAIEWNFLHFIGHLKNQDSHEDGPDISMIASAYAAWREARLAAATLFGPPTDDAAFSAAFQDTTSGLNAAYNATSDFYRRTVSDIERHLVTGQTLSNWASYVMVTAIVAGYLILILTGVYVSRSVLQPIESLREAALKLGNKDLSHRVWLRNPHDELGQLGTAFNDAATSLEEIYRDLEHRSTFDGLTGTHNRATFEDRLEAECHGADRHARALSLLMIDIDHFKDINDSHGHQTGDLILKRVGRILADATRAEDMVARYGGEEFVVVLPETTGAVAVTTAERLRRAVMRQASGYVDTGRVDVTVSIGVASRQPCEMGPKDLVKAADAALYHAKRSGRNRVESGAATSARRLLHENKPAA